MMNVAQVFPRLIGIVNFQQNMDDINNQLEQVKSSSKDFGTRSEDSYVLDQLIPHRFWV